MYRLQEPAVHALRCVLLHSDDVFIPDATLKQRDERVRVPVQYPVRVPVPVPKHLDNQNFYRAENTTGVAVLKTKHKENLNANSELCMPGKKATWFCPWKAKFKAFEGRCTRNLLYQ